MGLQTDFCSFTFALKKRPHKTQPDNPSHNPRNFSEIAGGTLCSVLVNQMGCSKRMGQCVPTGDTLSVQTSGSAIKAVSAQELGGKAACCQRGLSSADFIYF